MFGRDRESWQMWRQEDSGSHPKRKEKARVVQTLSGLGTRAPLPAWQHRRQTPAPVSYWMWEMGHSLLPSPLIFVTSFPHPLLAASVLYPPSVCPLLFSYWVISLPVPQIGPGDDWTQLFLSNNSAHLLPSSLPQTCKNTVTQNTEWQGQLPGQQQRQSQSCEQFLPFFAVHSYQVSAK